MSIDDTIFEIEAELPITTKNEWYRLLDYINRLELSHETLLLENRAMKRVIEIKQAPNSAIATDLRRPNVAPVPEHHQPPEEPDLGV